MTDEQNTENIDDIEKMAKVVSCLRRMKKAAQEIIDLSPEAEFNWSIKNYSVSGQTVEE